MAKVQQFYQLPHRDPRAGYISAAPCRGCSSGGSGSSSSGRDVEGAIARARKRSRALPPSEALDPDLTGEAGSCLHLRGACGSPGDSRLLAALSSDTERCGEALGLHRSGKHMVVYAEALRDSVPLAALVARTMAMFDLTLVDCWVNLYRDGSDCKSWHHDNYQDRQPRPTVTIGVSLGQARDLAFQHVSSGREYRVRQESGDIFAFDEPFNRVFKHSVPQMPASSVPCGKRIAVILWANESERVPRMLRMRNPETHESISWESWPQAQRLGGFSRSERRAARLAPGAAAGPGSCLPAGCVNLLSQLEADGALGASDDAAETASSSVSGAELHVEPLAQEPHEPAPDEQPRLQTGVEASPPACVAAGAPPEHGGMADLPEAELAELLATFARLASGPSPPRGGEPRPWPCTPPEAESLDEERGMASHCMQTWGSPGFASYYQTSAAGHTQSDGTGLVTGFVRADALRPASATDASTDGEDLAKVRSALTLQGAQQVLAILRGYKLIENRSWEIAEGWYALHSGAKEIEEERAERVRQVWPDAPAESSLPHCAIMGLFYVHSRCAPGDCRPGYVWARGPICHIISKAVELPRPVPCPGRRGLWELGSAQLEAVRAQLKEVTVSYFDISQAVR